MDYSKLKTVAIGRKVEDLPGLLKDLKAALFNISNVGSDERGTYLYMDMTERKDPRPIVEAWIGKKPVIQRPALSLFSRMFRKIW